MDIFLDSLQTSIFSSFEVVAGSFVKLMIRPAKVLESWKELGCVGNDFVRFLRKHELAFLWSVNQGSNSHSCALLSEFSVNVRQVLLWVVGQFINMMQSRSPDRLHTDIDSFSFSLLLEVVHQISLNPKFLAADLLLVNNHVVSVSSQQLGNEDLWLFTRHKEV